MSARIFHLPVKEPADMRLDAATEWLLCELTGPASISGLRALAEKELRRPRDAIHRNWAEVFLKETENYG